MRPFRPELGIVFTPLPKPQMPEVSVQQGNAPAESLFVQTSWVDSQGDESALSPVNGLVVNNQSTISVQMAEGALGAPPAAFGLERLRRIGCGHDHVAKWQPA